MTLNGELAESEAESDDAVVARGTRGSRLKLIKRQGYGRATLDLLRARVLEA